MLGAEFYIQKYSPGSSATQKGRCEKHYVHCEVSFGRLLSLIGSLAVNAGTIV